MSGVLASMTGVWARARTPRKPREAAAATPIGIGNIRIELTENTVLGLLGAELDGAGLLVDVFSGRVRPDRGAVRVAGADPARSAPTRARIALLSPWSAHVEPEPPIGRTGAELVANATSIRTGRAPDAAAARALLEGYGLGALAARATDAMTLADARGVELALALELPDPALVLLAEPLTRVGAIDLGKVRDRIAAVASRAPVVVTSPSVGELRTIARDVVVLSRGSLVQGGDAAALLDGPRRAEIHVWLASRAKETLRALLETPGICGASWEAHGSREDDEKEAASGGAGLLRVQHTSMEALALAIADAVVKVDARVVSMSEVAPRAGLSTVEAR